MQTPIGLRERLNMYGQEHLLDHWPFLTSEQQAVLLKQIESLDFALIQALSANRPHESKWGARGAEIEPPPTANILSAAPNESDAKIAQVGAQALRDGQVAVVLVAGGQGTRLGLDQPKGLLPIGPVSKRTLFKVLIDKVRARARTHGAPIPVFVMTSPATHQPTIEYFAAHENMGLPADQLEVFCQGTMPAVDLATGQILLAEKNQIFLSPDGHGGMLRALVECGGLERLKRRGIQYLFYGQVDNPLTQLCDPLTLGYHLSHRSEMTTQVIRKREPLQRVGNVVLLDGRLHVIEYSDLPESLARQTGPNGQLRLWAGNIAVHVFDLAFLERMKDQATSLPFHVAAKKVPYIDRSGQRHAPPRPNAMKFERFIFDLLPSAERAIVVEIDPAEGFAAVKNDATSATENIHTAQAAMIEQHKRWLRACGATVTKGIPIEISPLYALDAEQLAKRIDRAKVFEKPTYLR